MSIRVPFNEGFSAQCRREEAYHGPSLGHMMLTSGSVKGKWVVDDIHTSRICRFM
jgi:hypothetical protein